MKGFFGQRHMEKESMQRQYSDSELLNNTEKPELYRFYSDNNDEPPLPIILKRQITQGFSNLIETIGYILNNTEVRRNKN